MHIPYEERLKYPADFRVKYRYYSKAEGGRKRLPFQGIRSDFHYDDFNETFMIYPEFEDENGNVIIDDQIPVEREGTARMWIINSTRRPIHQKRIRIGTKGFFIEGKRVAECEVIELVGLHRNPVS